MKKWKILNNKFRVQSSEFRIEELLKVILQNRGIKTKKEIDEFLNPQLEKVTARSVGIDQRELQKAIKRIQKSIKEKEQIVVFGDYDVDGICGSAILWETLNSLGAKVLPYIPHRIEEGYGLSVKGIQNVILNLFQDPKEMPKPFDLAQGGQVRNDKKKRLIITVDNGIVASKAVEFANKQGIDVIITDHHAPSKNLPKAHAIVHTTKLCGAGVAWILSRVILNSIQDLKIPKPLKQVQGRNDIQEESHLELVALATVADLVPLTGCNRTLLKFGLEKLRTTNRVGLLELFKEAGIEQSSIDVYTIGHIIAPRLNAMGRIEYAMDSLRLLCTKDKEKAARLAQKLGTTNRERQQITEEAVLHAKLKVKSEKLKVGNLLFIAHESYQQGVIGLVAGKLVEEFYRPSIVVSKGEKYSKASARSVAGFNIIEFIRSASEFLVDAGGHPMAAGFTVETEKLLFLQQFLEKRAKSAVSDELLRRTLRVDCELPLSIVSQELYDELQELAPFGMGNPEPTFVAKNVVIEDMRVVGNEGKHLKLKFRIQNSEFRIDGIGFGMGERASEFHIADRVDIVYAIDEDRWLAPRSPEGEVGNGNKKLQLKIKDIRSR